MKDDTKKPHSLLDGLGSYYPMTKHPLVLDPLTDQVSTWNSVLTKKEMAELYWAGFPPLERRIKRYILYPTRLIYVWYGIKAVGRFLKRIW